MFSSLSFANFGRVWRFGQFGGILCLAMHVTSSLTSMNDVAFLSFKGLEGHLCLLSLGLFCHRVAQGDLSDLGQVPWLHYECLYAALVWSLVKSADF